MLKKTKKAQVLWELRHGRKVNFVDPPGYKSYVYTADTEHSNIGKRLISDWHSYAAQGL